jgi:elongation factor G
MGQAGNLDIRNIALVGHEHTGKTTLVESFLHQAGVTKKMGHIREKNTISDFELDEKESQKSHFMSTVSFIHEKKQFNILDVPGSPDSFGDVMTALRSVECALVCVDASADAILVNTRKDWDEAKKLGIPRIVSINRFDANNTNFLKKLGQITSSFSDRCIPVYWPEGSGPTFSKVYSTLHVEESAPAEVKEAHEKLMEAIIEADEELIEKYLGGGEVTDEELHNTLVKAIIAGTVFPVFVTSAEREIGTKELLHTLVAAVPPPDSVEREAIKGEEVVTLNSDGFVGFVYRTVSDDFVTRISHVRILSGKLPANGSFVNRRTGKTEKIGGLYRLCGKEQKVISAGSVGELVGITKVEDIRAGDTITDSATDLVIEKVEFPVPMVSLAIKLKSRKDEQKIGAVLHEIEGDDMTFHFVHDTQTGDLVISGMSDNHLKLMLSRLKRKYKVDVETSIPSIPYKETITKAVKKVDYTHKKQSGGAGQFAKVFIDLEPLPRGGGYEFVDKIVGGVIDQVFRTSVDKGVQSKISEGVIAGYPAVDLRVRLTDGKTHTVDSKDIAFQIAGREAFKKAFLQCAPVLLEPVVMMEVSVPQEKMGDIMGDINSRRGKIISSGAEGATAIVSSLIPLAEILTYQADLKSLTGGEGNYTIHFDHYDIVPPNIQKDIIAKHEKEKTESEKKH